MSRRNTTAISSFAVIERFNRDFTVRPVWDESRSSISNVGFRTSVGCQKISPVIRAETLPAGAGPVPLTGAKGSPQSSLTEERGSRSGMEGEMANCSAAGSRLVDRRTVLQGAAALAAAGPVAGSAKGMPPRGRQWSSMPRSTPMPRTRLSGRGTTFRTGPLTSPATRWWRRWTRSASTARSTSRRSRCTSTTPAMRSRCNVPTPTSSPWSNRSTRMIRRWPMSSPTGRRRRARSASASF